MSITILKASSKGMRTFKLGKRSVYYLLAFILTLPLITGFFGYYSHNPKDHSLTQRTILQWKNKLKQQKKEVEKAKQKSAHQIRALTIKFAMLQAHVRRLDAIGERILGVSGIDSKEFNFNQALPVGGPDHPLFNSKKLFLGEAFKHLEDLLISKEQQMFILESLLIDKQLDGNRFVSGKPTDSGWLSSFYGERTDPFNGKQAWHSGIDFAGKEGDPIFSTAAGVVIWVGENSGYGLLVEINHGNGLITRYAHNQSSNVKIGELVKKGQVISYMGNSGRSTGAHVHYEIIKNGKKVNPLKYVKRKEKKL
jgi:murein DD-endopeptidase MepM/ murein hydrolase activator NlpD